MPKAALAKTKQHLPAVEHLEFTRDNFDVLVRRLGEKTRDVQSDLILAGVWYERVKENGLWKDWGYTSLSAYREHLVELSGYEQSTFYAVAATSKKLLDAGVTVPDLVQMGRQKADVLKQFPSTGTTIPASLLEQALDNVVDHKSLQLKAMTVLNGPPPEATKYYGLSYYVLPEDQVIIEKAFQHLVLANNITGSKQGQAGEVLRLLAVDYLSGVTETEEL